MYNCSFLHKLQYKTITADHLAVSTRYFLYQMKKTALAVLLLLLPVLAAAQQLHLERTDSVSMRIYLPKRWAHYLPDMIGGFYQDKLLGILKYKPHYQQQGGRRWRGSLNGNLDSLWLPGRADRGLAAMIFPCLHLDQAQQHCVPGASKGYTARKLLDTLNGRHYWQHMLSLATGAPCDIGQGLMLYPVAGFDGIQPDYTAGSEGMGLWQLTDSTQRLLRVFGEQPASAYAHSNCSTWEIRYAADSLARYIYMQHCTGGQIGAYTWQGDSLTTFGQNPAGYETWQNPPLPDSMVYKWPWRVAAAYDKQSPALGARVRWQLWQTMSASCMIHHQLYADAQQGLLYRVVRLPLLPDGYSPALKALAAKLEAGKGTRKDFVRATNLAAGQMKRVVQVYSLKTRQLLGEHQAGSPFFRMLYVQPGHIAVIERYNTRTRRLYVAEYKPVMKLAISRKNS